MANWMAQSVLFAHRAQLRVAGVDIVYKAKGKLPVALKAIRAHQLNAVDGEIEGFRQSDDRWDWIVEACRLPFLPERGHRIEDASGQVYEVLPTEGERAFSWSDHGRQLIRVHTKVIQ